MAITLTKTLQGTEYADLYSVCEPMTDIGTLAVFGCKVYQSEGHYNDGFLPLVSKQEVVTDSSTLTTYRSFVPTDMPAAIATIEQYIVTQPGFHQGGTVG